MTALVLAACCGGALGCRDVREAAQGIAREDPAAASPPPAKPGGDADGSSVVVPPPAAKGVANTTDGELSAAPREDAAEPDLADGDVDDEAKPAPRPRRASASKRGRRRRPAPAARPSNANPAGDGPDAHAAADDVPSAAGAPELKVTRLVVSRAVRAREPVGAARSFAAGDVEQIYAFVELANEARAPSEIFVTFTPPHGGALQRIRLNVGAERRWRTWALTRKAKAPGDWKVAVRDADGDVLARTSFRITK